MKPQDIRALARALFDAREKGYLVDPRTVSFPVDVQTAYEVQNALAAYANEHIVGFKIGASTEGVIDALGLSEPFFAPMFKRYCLGRVRKVPIHAAHTVYVEAEIAYRLSGSLPSRNERYSITDVKGVIECVMPAIELCSCRFDAPFLNNGPMLIADSGINTAFVEGSPESDWSHHNLTNLDVMLSINGANTASGNPGCCVTGDPLMMVLWLANHPKLSPRGLLAGDVITTGSCTGLTPVNIGDRVEANFGHLGTIVLAMEPFRPTSEPLRSHV